MKQTWTTPTETVRAKRILRAKQSVVCLELSGHNLWGGLLLDLGCGPGWLTEYYVSLGIEAIGLDSHKRMRIFKKAVPICDLVWADGRWLPFRDDSFHTVILNDVLEHVPYSSADRLLVEVRRILNRTSRLYVSVANRYQMVEPHTGIYFLTWLPRPCWNIVCRLTKKGQTFNYYPYTAKQLTELLEKHKFLWRNFTWLYASQKIGKPEYVGNLIPRIMIRLLRKLRLLRFALSIAEKVSVILFVCRKGENHFLV